jgi:site-specific DNA recombinase
MRVAIYARHSTDKQEHSTRDQIARCEAFCRRVGYEVAATFCDEGISGAAMQNRPGIRRLIEAALDGGFNRIISEDLSRISRDQGDLAHFYKKLLFLNISLETVAEGDISELHIGLKGTMNALYLKDLADKTKRGMLAAVLNGSIPGGRTFGYDIVHRLNERGEPIAGLRKINTAEADVVRAIFNKYDQGETLLRICEFLNDSGAPPPKGGTKWQKSALIGTFARQTGILRNTLYKGVLTFDKMAYRKHPETGKRLSAVRPESEWLRVPAPELAIVEEGLFDRVQEHIEDRSNNFRQRRLIIQVMTGAEKAKRQRGYLQKWRARQIKSGKKVREQPLYITTGKLWCAKHDAAFIHRRSRLNGCPHKGCANQNLPLEYVLPLVLEDVQRFSAADLSAYYEENLTRRTYLEGELQRLVSERTRVQSEIRSLLETIARAQRGPETLANIQEREKESGRLKLDVDQAQSELSDVTAIPDAAMAVIAQRVQEHINKWLSSDLESTKILHACIYKIRIIPSWNDAEDSMQHRAKVVWDMPAIIRTFSRPSKKIAA